MLRRVASVSFTALLATAVPLSAQLVRGRVLEEGSGVPITVAVVSLLTSDSALTGRRTLTDEAGSFALSAPAPGSYLIEVRSIGFGRRRQSISVASGETRFVDVHVARNSISIAAVRVEGRRNCRPPDHIANSTSLIWDDVWAALSATTLADRGGASPNAGFRYTREWEATSRQVISETREGFVGLASTPFTAANPRDLARLGFLHEDDSRNLMMFAPDARTFLSPEFISTHCFSLTRRDSGATVWIGIAFWPQRSWARRGIEGVFWLDAVTREIRQVDFTYPGLSHLASPALGLGGQVEFARSAKGAWLVSRWYIRAPIVQRQERYVNWRGRRVEQDPRDSVASVSEEGGIVLSAATRFASFGGFVVDATTRQPLAGSRVELLGTTIMATVDSAGRFLLDTLLPGTYRVRVTRTGWGEPRGVWHNQIVSVKAGEHLEQRMAVPPQQSLARLLCAHSNQRAHSTAAVYALARDDQSGAPLAERSFELRWLRYIIEGASNAIGWRTETQALVTDSAGVLNSCQIPSRADVSIRDASSASTDWSSPVRVGADLTVLEVRVNSARQIRSVDGGIPVAVSQTPPTPERRDWGQLKGVVIADDSDATPVAGVDVLVDGLLSSAKTGFNGHFTLDSVSMGPHVLSLRRLGFAPLNQVVSVVADEAIVYQFRLARVAATLQEIRVTAATDDPSPELQAFRDRQRHGLGKFLDPEDFQRSSEMSLATLIALRIQGFELVSVEKGSLSSGLAIAARRFSSTASGAPRHCFVQVFVDGARASARGEAWDVTQLKTSEIAAMEFYRGAAETPTQYSGPSAACGTVLIWTRRK